MNQHSDDIGAKHEDLRCCHDDQWDRPGLERRPNLIDLPSLPESGETPSLL